MGKLPTDKIISCFYDSSEDCVKVIDTEGMMLSFNPNGLEVMEIDNPKDVIGKNWLKFWRGDLEGKATKAIEKAISGQLASFKGYCPTFKGTMKYWEVQLAPLKDESGGVQWILVTSRDMTKYKRMEDSLVRLQAELDNLKHQNVKTVSAAL